MLRTIRKRPVLIKNLTRRCSSIGEFFYAREPRCRVLILAKFATYEEVDAHTDNIVFDTHCIVQQR